MPSTASGAFGDLQIQGNPLSVDKHYASVDELLAGTVVFLIAAQCCEGEKEFYGFSFAGDLAFCREGYVNGDALLAHVENVGSLIQEALQISALARVEVHGPETELAKLRGPLANLSVQFFVLEYGFRR